MSLYELFSTTVEMEQLSNEESGTPEVSDEDWEGSMDLISDLAKFDPTLRLE